ncbi:flavin reductase [Candidatus Magnetomorum sp. HK-1]|nr:flavin reductase [Candidatus Magnetomorum sp. HK-1]
MKKWKCSVCAYVHSGDSPPDTCPVCGANKDKFIEIEDSSATDSTDIQWRCNVCAYIHKGPEPPDTCPVCGADKTKFERVGSETSTSSSKAASQRENMRSDREQTMITKVYDFICENVINHHLHPISVHFPNGIIPVAVLFVLMSAVFGSANVALAAFYNTVFVTLAMPIVLFTGYVEWQRRYGGTFTNLFITKIICGIVVLAMAILLTLWGIFDESVTQNNAVISWLYIFFYLVMLGAAGVAGHLGGKLVFKE